MCRSRRRRKGCVGEDEGETARTRLAGIRATRYPRETDVMTADCLVFAARSVRHGVKSALSRARYRALAV